MYNEVSAQSVEKMDTSQLTKFLESIHFDHEIIVKLKGKCFFINVFSVCFTNCLFVSDEDVYGSIYLTLTENEMLELGLKFGQRKKLPVCNKI